MSFGNVISYTLSNLGIGYGLVFTSSVLAISVHFHDYRTVAIGVTMAGIGLGTFVYPFFANVVLNIYEWRGALIITSGLTLNTCVFGCLIGPEPAEQARRKDKTRHNMGSVENHVTVKPISRCHSFTRFHYWLILVHVFLINFSLSVLGTHVIAYAEDQGHSHVFASSLLAASGISSLAGRVIHGVVIHNPRVSASIYHLVCFLLVGLSYFSMALWTNQICMMVSVIILGYFFAARGPVVCEVLLQICGTDDFSYGYGFMFLSAGPGYVLGAPCAGLLTTRSIGCL